MMFVAFQSTKSNQHGLDIHKLPLHIAINGQNVCVKVYFIKWPEGMVKVMKTILAQFTTA